jgi:hypothetical protein
MSMLLLFAINAEIRYTRTRPASGTAIRLLIKDINDAECDATKAS